MPPGRRGKPSAHTSLAHLGESTIEGWGGLRSGCCGARPLTALRDCPPHRVPFGRASGRGRVPVAQTTGQTLTSLLVGLVAPLQVQGAPQHCVGWSRAPPCALGFVLTSSFDRRTRVNYRRPCCSPDADTVPPLSCAHFDYSPLVALQCCHTLWPLSALPWCATPFHAARVTAAL